MSYYKYHYYTQDLIRGRRALLAEGERIVSASMETRSPNSLYSFLSITEITSIFSRCVCSLSFLPNLLLLDASPLFPGPVDLLWVDLGGTEKRTVRDLALRRLRPSAVAFINISHLSFTLNLNLSSPQH